MTGHATPGDLCADDCHHTCPACGRGETCEDMFEHPIAGVIACMNDEEVLICQVGTCVKPAQPEHSPCCSSTFHGKSFCCEHYCRSHFVEAHPCTPESHAVEGNGE